VVIESITSAPNVESTKDQSLENIGRGGRQTMTKLSDEEIESIDKALTKTWSMNRMESNRYQAKIRNNAYRWLTELVAEVIAKYGPPTRPYGSYSSIATPPTRQQGGAKRGTVRDKSKANGKRTNDAKGKVEGPGSTKVSGL
jgi:hypothetical protein